MDKTEKEIIDELQELMVGRAKDVVKVLQRVKKQSSVSVDFKNKLARTMYKIVTNSLVDADYKGIAAMVRSFRDSAAKLRINSPEYKKLVMLVLSTRWFKAKEIVPAMVLPEMKERYLFYEMARQYAFDKDKAQALKYVALARKMGVKPSHFKEDSFTWLRKEPALQRALKS